MTAKDAGSRTGHCPLIARPPRITIARCGIPGRVTRIATGIFLYSRQMRYLQALSGITCHDGSTGEHHRGSGICTFLPAHDSERFGQDHPGSKDGPAGS